MFVMFVSRSGGNAGCYARALPKRFVNAHPNYPPA